MPDTLAHRRIFGLLVPYFNSVVQPELDGLRPAGVSNQTARFTLDADVLDDIGAAAEKLMACGIEAFVIGLATESFPDGLTLLRAGADRLAERTDRPVFTASHATHAALRRIGATRLGVVTPFDAQANEHVRRAFEASAFEVAAIHGLACTSFDTIARTPVAEIRRAFAAADRADAEAIVQVGTGLPVLALVDELERTLGKPVIACNAASYWQALRETGLDDRIDGFGTLLREH